MPEPNYCSIDPNGGQIKVTLVVDNGVRTGAKFVLWELIDENWKAKEKFDMSTGDDGMDDQILLENPFEIKEDSLAWKIVACNQMAQTEMARFTLRIWQNGVVKFESVSNRKVPKCQDDKALKFGNHVVFKHDGIL